MDIIQALEINRKLEEARKSIKFLFGDDYEKKIAPWKKLVKTVMEKYDLSVFQAAIKLSKERGDGVFEDGITTLVILSAACDLAEEQ